MTEQGRPSFADRMLGSGERELLRAEERKAMLQAADADRSDREPYDDPGSSLTPLRIERGVLRCPQCTWNYDLSTVSVAPLAGQGSQRTYGCRICRGSGHARTWIADAERIGGHWHIGIRTGRPHSTALCGTVTLDDHDWADLKNQLASPELRDLWEIIERKET